MLVDKRHFAVRTGRRHNQEPLRNFVHHALYDALNARLYIYRCDGRRHTDYGSMTREEARERAKWYGCNVMIIGRAWKWGAEKRLTPPA